MKTALKVSEVAAMVGVHPAVIYKLAKRGELPHYRIGKTVRIPRDWVEEWLHKITVAGPQAEK